MSELLPGQIPEPLVIGTTILLAAIAAVRLGRGLIALSHDFLGLLRDWRDFRRGN